MLSEVQFRLIQRGFEKVAETGHYGLPRLVPPSGRLHARHSILEAAQCVVRLSLAEVQADTLKWSAEIVGIGCTGAMMAEALTCDRRERPWESHI